MAVIQVKDLRFAYEGSAQEVFSGLSFNMDSAWRLGLVGRNGRGKTTLLRLLAGELRGAGQVHSAVPFDLFPFLVPGQRPAGQALLDALAPYTEWEAGMEACLKAGTPGALAQYADLEHRYALHGGYGARGRLMKEVALLGLDPEALVRPFDSFSPGEQARLKLAALFLREGRFLLIDEPTNHLDLQGRDRMAGYLKGKSGFLIASHDRDILNEVCTHTLALERQGARLVAGNYASYREDKRREDEHERDRHDSLLAEISRLGRSAREKAAWSDRVEAGKTGQGPVDRGYVGHQSARMMKRARSIQGRIQRQIEEKEGLLRNLEYASPLKIQAVPHPSRTLLRFEGVSFRYGEGAPLFAGLDLALHQGERLALSGSNGAGKTTLLKLMEGALSPTSGSVWRPRGLSVSTLPQTGAHLRGSPRALALERGLDLTLFLTLLRKFDLPREAFDQEAGSLSLGQRKKLMLSLSLAQPAHLYLWDEPLNDIDPESREQVEELLAGASASLVFIEHERTFLRRVATREIEVGGLR